MIHPTQRPIGFPYAVRDRGGAPVTCAACGCRLEGAGDGAWRHFAPIAGRDARGCRVACADLVHDAGGWPLSD